MYEIYEIITRMQKEIGNDCAIEFSSRKPGTLNVLASWLQTGTGDPPFRFMREFPAVHLKGKGSFAPEFAIEAFVREAREVFQHRKGRG